MSCNKCSCTPCNCSSGLKPYYVTDPCLEEECNKVFVCHYTPVVKVQGEWAVPEADQIVTLKIPALMDVLVGSVLWSPEYGSYEIVAFDDNELVKVRKTVYNDVENGTTIPSCTKFIVNAPIQEVTLIYEDFDPDPVTVTPDAIVDVTLNDCEYAVNGEHVDLLIKIVLDLQDDDSDSFSLQLPFSGAVGELNQMAGNLIANDGSDNFDCIGTVESGGQTLIITKKDGTAFAEAEYTITGNIFYKRIA